MNVNVASNGRLLRMADIADVKRSYFDPRSPFFASMGNPRSGLQSP